MRSQKEALGYFRNRGSSDVLGHHSFWGIPRRVSLNVGSDQPVVTFVFVADKWR
ncbi:MAG: hypothetical protein ACKOW3_10255 [Hyphomicrobium sp.]